MQVEDKAMHAAAASAVKSAPRKLLVAEGDPQTARMIVDLLTRLGFEVILAREDRDALRRALSDSPDAILLDAALMTAGGLDICSMLRSHKDTKNIPLGFLTGDPGSEKAARQAGALLLIPKPFKPEQLISSVGLLVSARRRKPAA
jgi:DNA-binding response OmpR family regulator